MSELLFWQIHTDKMRNTTLDHKYNRSIIECCNNTHQGVPHTGKQTSACASDLGGGSHVTCELFVVLRTPAKVAPVL